MESAELATRPTNWAVFGVLTSSCSSCLSVTRAVVVTTVAAVVETDNCPPDSGCLLPLSSCQAVQEGQWAVGSAGKARPRNDQPPRQYQQQKQQHNITSGAELSSAKKSAHHTKEKQYHRRNNKHSEESYHTTRALPNAVARNAVVSLRSVRTTTNGVEIYQAVHSSDLLVRHSC